LILSESLPLHLQSTDSGLEYHLHLPFLITYRRVEKKLLTFLPAMRLNISN